MGLNRDQILKAKDLKRESVEVPEWGGDVNVRAMTGTERDAFEQSIFKDKKSDMSNIRARLVSLTLVDDEGNRLFEDKDVEVLGGKSAAALDRVFSVAQKLNGIGDQDVEDLAKNSKTGQ